MAAGGGKLEVLIWAYENGCPLTDLVCSYASEHDQTEIINWIKENQYPIYKEYFGRRN